MTKWERNHDWAMLGAYTMGVFIGAVIGFYCGVMR